MKKQLKSSSTLRVRKYRAKNPVLSAYNNLKHNCKRRYGLNWFYLTFEDFRQFAIETQYIGRKGRLKSSYHIDRIDSSMGYFIGNIRVLKCCCNSARVSKNMVYFYDGKKMVFRFEVKVTSKEFLF